MSTVFALMLVFSDGYVGGHSNYASYPNKPACERAGSQVAAQFTRDGHPASFICTETKKRKPLPKKPDVIDYSVKTLPPG